MTRTILAAITCIILAPLARAESKPLVPSQTWKGSIADVTLQAKKPANGVITSAADFEALVKDWNVAEKVPEVDFAKDLVLVATTRGGVLRLSATLNDSGDVRISAISTRDLRPGFRYMIIAVPREGVKSVDGKPLPR